MRVLAGLACVALVGLGQAAEQDVQVLAQGCGSGRFEDCRQLLLLAEVNRGTAPDLLASLAPVFDRAREAFVLACDRGDASDSGCFGAGMMHAAKRPEELARAVTFYERSCSGGYAPGCTQLGNAEMYERGLGVRQDAKRAVRLYARACEAGLTDACRGRTSH